MAKNKTRRGVYLDVASSDILYIGKNEKIYRFSSKKKKEIFLRKIAENKEKAKKVADKYYKITGIAVFYDEYLIEFNTYKNMRYI